MSASRPNFDSPAPDPSEPAAQPAQRQLLPLTVWLCPDADQPATGEQTAAGGGGLCFRHRYAVGRELARHLITTCTGPDDLIVDAYTSSEVTLSAAAELGRWAIACVPYPPLARHLGDRLRAGIPAHALAWLAMRPVTAETLASGLSDIAGKVRLIVAAVPDFDGRGHLPIQRAGVSPGCQACQGQTRRISQGQLRSFLLGCRKILAPGGNLAIVTTARHQAGRLVDPGPVIIANATRLGLAYTQHVVALRVPVAGEHLVVQAGPKELAQLREPGSASPPPAARVHADVYLFTKPARTPSGSGEAKGGAR